MLNIFWIVKALVVFSEWILSKLPRNFVDTFTEDFMTPQCRRCRCFRTPCRGRAWGGARRWGSPARRSSSPGRRPEAAAGLGGNSSPDGCQCILYLWSYPNHLFILNSWSVCGCTLFLQQQSTKATTSSPAAMISIERQLCPDHWLREKLWVRVPQFWHQHCG